MLKRFRSAAEAKLDAQIDEVLTRMSAVGVEDDEYSQLITKLERLNEVKAKERRSPVSRDTMVLVLGNLAGIIVIVAYEHAHVVTSKALGQLHRPTIGN